ncbi:A disintegrin and metalloproteinase with thrombospondin motifs 6 isoform X2 [Xylocopa sonorina]|uniref:A disintegrin and metalloproteinase with thrombospondin motifs 6 isoform X2 n=1 Tax=Xylocopa sonorina TaxID=1818115 RepID=UPI00403A89C0
MDRSRKSRNDRSTWSPAEPPRRQRCASRGVNNPIVKNFGSILALTMLTVASVSCTHVPDKYPIEVYHMLREKTQFALGRDNRIRGTWGPWSTWSDCSRTCGTGIQSQSRECVPYQRLLRKRSIISENGTSNSRPICIGTYKRYHTCNTQKCPNFPEDLRAEQCAKYNGRNYKGESYDWVPFLDVPNSCALNCRAVGERFYATLEPTVMDGTPCDAPNLRGHNNGISMERTDRWLCVAGQCKPVGCDGVVGSGVTMDACGVCGGQGKGCRLYEGIFMEPILPRGHQHVATVPKGAMSLNISELRFSSNFLALRDSNGSYILNGPLAYSPSGTYKAAGTTLTYQRGDKNRMECISATGPLNDSLHLEILAQEMNPGVLYKYMMPLKEGLGGRPLIAPPFFVPGSSDRGNEIPGSDTRVALTIPSTRIFNQKTDLSSRTYDPDRARARDRGRKAEMKHSSTTAMAGDQPKSKGKKKKRLRFSWKVYGTSPCSKECGGGVQTAIFKCVREANQMIVNEKRCRNVGKPQQPPPLRCNDNPCPPRWRAEPWGECSVTCGTGSRTRKLECVQELNANLTMRVAAGACVQPPDLRTVETCTKPGCANGPELRHMHSQHDTPRWDVGAWGPCSATCGTGVQTRLVRCILEGVTSSNCDEAVKPDVQQRCSLDPCKKDPPPPSKPPKKAFEPSPECVDKHPNCALVMKNDLCRLNYYKYSCCRCRE